MRGASWPASAAARWPAGDGQRRAKYTFASFVGTSPAASEVKRQARRAAQSSSPVLLLGETGTGKELLAHAIHAASAVPAARLSA
jgi:transcriptional regulator with PAS, ATPase and Fis domain